MRPTRMTPLLNVLDINTSSGFYEALGFTVQEQWDGGEGRVWCLLVCGDLRIMLNQTVRAASDHRLARPDYSDLVLYLYVENAQTCWKELQAMGLAGRHVGPQDYGLDESGYGIPTATMWSWRVMCDGNT